VRLRGAAPAGGLLAGGAVAVAVALARRRRHPRVARVALADPSPTTVVGREGAVRSVQAAELILPETRLEEIWDPTHLERLARTYWRFLTRVSAGLIRVVYTPGDRAVVALGRPLRLLRFQAPEYAMDGRRGIVRWRIEDGVLVARAGRGGVGHLQIDIARRPAPMPGEAVAHVEVEVSNFYPSIASGLSTWLYRLTQDRIHVLITHAFLRSLARLDLGHSKVGALAGIAELPDPPPPGEPLPG
jgi:hypothetical protein